MYAYIYHIHAHTIYTSHIHTLCIHTSHKAGAHEVHITHTININVCTYQTTHIPTIVHTIYKHTIIYNMHMHTQ